LRTERRKYEFRGRAGTKPGTLLKKQIPIRTFAEWDEQCPGFVEIDLVAHDGGLAAGDYCQTLDLADIATTERGSFRRRANHRSHATRVEGAKKYGKDLNLAVGRDPGVYDNLLPVSHKTRNATSLALPSDWSLAWLHLLTCLFPCFAMDLNGTAKVCLLSSRRRKSDALCL
jgi:hypothetical protein